MKKVKVKFLRPVIDKYDSTKRYETGEVHEFDNWRAHELVTDPRGLAKLKYDTDELTGMKLAELRAIAEMHGINVKGMKKADIITALVEE